MYLYQSPSISTDCYWSHPNLHEKRQTDQLRHHLMWTENLQSFTHFLTYPNYTHDLFLWDKSGIKKKVHEHLAHVVYARICCIFIHILCLPASLPPLSLHLICIVDTILRRSPQVVRIDVLYRVNTNR